MIRTSLLLPNTLHKRLLTVAKQEAMPLSSLARDLLDTALAKREQAQMKHVYEVLNQLEGIGPKGVTDASTTIDDVLYGEKGAWRGSGAAD
jgi:hypothetical protein